MSSQKSMKLAPHHRPLYFCLTFCLCLSLAAPLKAQKRCQPPALPSSGSQANIFTPEQENHLGDAVSEHLQRNFRVIYDEALNARLQEVGEKLLKQLPPTA